MHHMLKKLIYLSMLFFTPEVLANIFEPSQFDYSIKLLGTLFGQSIGSEVLGGIAQPVFAQIIQHFNLIIVTVGIITAGYISIVSVANTSQEGSVMGEKWSAVWVPVRSVVGLALMVPSPTSGYSAIQAIVMWVVVNGVGAADSLWNIVLNAIKDGAATAISLSSPNNINPNIAGQYRDPDFSLRLLQANVCMKALASLANFPKPNSDKMTVQKALYDELHGSSNSPSSTYSDLFKYANTLSAYLTNIQTSAPNTTDPKTKYTMSGDLNFGANNAANPLWANICGTMNVSVSIETDDYADSTNVPYLGTAQKKDLERIFNVAISSIQAVNTSYALLATAIINGNVEPRTKLTDTDSNPNYTFLKSISRDQAKDLLTPAGYINLGEQVYSQNIMTGTVPLKQGGWVEKAINDGFEQGWMTAGSFYFLLSRNNGDQKLFKSLTGAKAPGTFSSSPLLCPPLCPGDANDTKTCVGQAYAPDSNNQVETKAVKGTDKTQVANVLGSQSYAEGYITMFLAQANVYYNIDKPLSTGDKINPAMSSPNDVSATISSLGQLPGGGGGNTNIIQLLINSIGSGDVIVGLSQYGYSLMVTAEASLAAIYTLLTGTSVAVGLSATEINIWPIGSFQFRGFSEMWSVIVPLILSLVIPLFTSLWTLGATLNIYLPVIPYMIFTVTAIGWGILVIEAIIAAPILALSLVTPGGDELGKAEEGIGILAGIALRPALMVLGFLLASKIYQAIVSVVNIGMIDSYKFVGLGGATGNGQGTMFSWIAAMAIYVAFVVSLANKCFGFIYMLPDQILRWIGGNRENSSANQELGEAKQAQESTNTAINATGSGATQYSAKISDRAAEKADALDRKREKDFAEHKKNMTPAIDELKSLKRTNPDENANLKPSEVRAQQKAQREAQKEAQKEEAGNNANEGLAPKDTELGGSKKGMPDDLLKDIQKFKKDDE